MRNVHTKYKWLFHFQNGSRVVSTEQPYIISSCPGINKMAFPTMNSINKQIESGVEIADEFIICPIDHFADVPERFKYIFMSSGGLKVASLTLPTIFKSSNGNCMWVTTYEYITIGNTGEPCDDWKDSLIERPSAKESLVEPTDLELMTIERDSYKSENNALKAEITILEGKLKQSDAENRHSKLRFKDMSELSQQIDVWGNNTCVYVFSSL